MLRKWPAGTSSGVIVCPQVVCKLRSSGQPSGPGRVREPWVHVTTNPAAAEQRQSSLAKKRSSHQSNRLSCQTIISRSKNNNELLCRCSAARLFVRQVTQGRRLALGRSSDRCSAAWATRRFSTPPHNYPTTGGQARNLCDSLLNSTGGFLVAYSEELVAYTEDLFSSKAWL